MSSQVTGGFSGLSPAWLKQTFVIQQHRSFSTEGQRVEMIVICPQTQVRWAEFVVKRQRFCHVGDVGQIDQQR